jgi:hypothetical protein
VDAETRRRLEDATRETGGSFVISRHDVIDLMAEVDRLTAERDALISAWPVWTEGGEADRVVVRQDGGWWLDTVGLEGEYPDKTSAVRAAAGLDTPTEQPK